MKQAKGGFPPRDLVCFSHLRWNFVFQRPQHLLSRAGKIYRVHYFEEPVMVDSGPPRLDTGTSTEGVQVVVPQMPADTDPANRDRVLKGLIDEYLGTDCTDLAVTWYYTPMAWRFTRHLQPAVRVYDCMDELASFKGAPPEIALMERELMRHAQVVFTGGQSLYESKRRFHANVHAFPSSVDAAHYLPARSGELESPTDVAGLPRPRIGFFGVIDERLDAGLVDAIAEARPDWQLVMIGPVVKIDPAALPRRANIHWLGGKDYADLPRYLSALDVGFMPFAMNEATRFISPTKTPEFLAAGLPVVSTPIVDVVRTWGAWGLVEIADDAAGAIAAIEAQLQRRDRVSWLKLVDRKLASTSWDSTWSHMLAEIEEIAQESGSVQRVRTGEIEQVSRV